MYGDWGLGIGPNPQSPIPNPQSPIPNPQTYYFYYFNKFFLTNELIKIGDWGLGIGDWGLGMGIGDWGLGPIPKPQTPKPHRLILN